MARARARRSGRPVGLRARARRDRLPATSSARSTTRWSCPVALERIGTASLTLREEIRTADGEVSAESEAVIVARDRENGGSRPLKDVERAAFERAL